MADMHEHTWHTLGSLEVCECGGVRGTTDTAKSTLAMMRPDQHTCGGCGDISTEERPEGWRFTDGPWCPKCAWLA